MRNSPSTALPDFKQFAAQCRGQQAVAGRWRHILIATFDIKRSEAAFGQPTIGQREQHFVAILRFARLIVEIAVGGFVEQAEIGGIDRQWHHRHPQRG